MNHLGRERRSYVSELVGELLACIVLIAGGTLFVSAATLI
jgi:hypothetical protein